MVERKTWEQFRDAKLLWFINSILHLFGWAIVLDYVGDTVVEVYPARVKFRGFDEASNTAGYIGLTEYMLNNCEQLLKEAKDEDM